MEYNIYSNRMIRQLVQAHAFHPSTSPSLQLSIPLLHLCPFNPSLHRSSLSPLHLSPLLHPLPMCHPSRPLHPSDLVKLAGGGSRTRTPDMDLK